MKPILAAVLHRASLGFRVSLADNRKLSRPPGRNILAGCRNDCDSRSRFRRADDFRHPRARALGLPRAVTTDGQTFPVAIYDFVKPRYRDCSACTGCPIRNRRAGNTSAESFLPVALFTRELHRVARAPGTVRLEVGTLISLTIRET